MASLVNIKIGNGPLAVAIFRHHHPRLDTFFQDIAGREGHLPGALAHGYKPHLAGPKHAAFQGFFHRCIRQRRRDGGFDDGIRIPAQFRHIITPFPPVR